MKTRYKLLFLMINSLSIPYCVGQTNIFPSSGNVGIGTTSANSMLHVYQSNPNQSGLIIQGNTINTDNFPHYIALTLDGDYGNGTGNYSQIRSYSNLYTGWGSKLSFHTTSSTQANTLEEQMVIDSRGNLGIGTSYPRSHFDVGKHLNGGRLGSVLGRLTEGDSNGDGTFLGVRGYNTNIIDGKSFSLTHSFYGLENSSINFHRGGSSTGGFISLSTDNNIERMRIDVVGNVGIGTTTPQEKLSVNGKIRAKEVKVEVSNWPDYVFSDDYELGSLKDLDYFIKTNRHLPEVPSAVEVEKNGYELGKMDKILLKKVEELTLHLIEKDKQLCNQNTVIKRLSEQMDSLQQQIKQMKNEKK